MLHHFRRRSAFAYAALLALIVRAASAEQPERGGLAGQIEAAFQERYLVADLAGAERELLAIIQSCDASCARRDLAKAWMYIGILRASGAADPEGSRQAFEQALVLDPSVELDRTVAGQESLRRFADAGGRVDVAELEPRTTESGPARTEDLLRAEAARAGLVCGPVLATLETRRVLPVWCETRDKFWRMTLRYLAFNADGWVSQRMDRAASEFRAEIPCTATEFAGPLKYFVTVTDREGGLIATLGNLKEPIVLQVAEDVAEAPPSFPSEPPGERCTVRETCPPDFPGCDDGSLLPARGDRELAEACNDSEQCRPGLYCEAGRCTASPRCDIDADCGAEGVCIERVCHISARGEREAKPRPASHFFGLHFGADFGPVAGTDVCSTQNTEFDCFTQQGSQPYPSALPDAIAIEEGEPGDAYPGSSVGGVANGSLRVLLSYDRVVWSKLSLGARLGVAFNGGDSRVDEPAFLPLHLEARASYWLFGTDRAPVRPYFFVNAGLAQVDLSEDLVVQDCSTQPTRQRFEDCIQRAGDYEEPPADLPEVEVTATRKLGRGFAGVGAGAFVPVFANLGIAPALGAIVTFPEVGFVVQPSLGLMYAF